MKNQKKLCLFSRFYCDDSSIIFYRSLLVESLARLGRDIDFFHFARCAVLWCVFLGKQFGVIGLRFKFNLRLYYADGAE